MQYILKLLHCYLLPLKRHENSGSSIQHPVSSIQYPVSSIQYPVSIAPRAALHALRKALPHLIFLCLIFILTSCRQSSHAPISRTDFLLGTYVNITSYDSELPEAQIDQALDEALGVIRDIEQQTNPYDRNSFIGRLNAGRGEARSVPLPPRLRALAEAALQLSNDTGGSFDFTLWPVFRRWHFESEHPKVPPADTIQAYLPRVDFRQVQLDSARLTVAAATELDFSGIVKGFAVEAAREVLQSHGLENFIIDAGGNLGLNWQRAQSVEIQVRHPRREGAFWGSFPLQNSCGIATSGDYHFYFMEDGRRYHHVLDPHTGYPVAQMVSTTIIAPNATLADGYSTAVFVMGVAAGQQFIESHPELEGLMIYQEGDSLATYLSPGLRGVFKPAW